MAGQVDFVYRHPQAHIEPVLVNSATPNVFMAVVLYCVAKTVIGHHLLNLERLYGIAG